MPAQPIFTVGPRTVLVLDGREGGGQRIQDERGVADRVVRVKDGVQAPVPEAGLEHLGCERAVDAQEPAHTVEREAEAQLNTGEGRRNRHNQRPGDRPR